MFSDFNNDGGHGLNDDLDRKLNGLMTNRSGELSHSAVSDDAMMMNMLLPDAMPPQQNVATRATPRKRRNDKSNDKLSSKSNNKSKNKTSESMDSAPITRPKKDRPDDLGGIVKDMACSLNYKLIFLLFLFFLAVTSDVFMQFLDKFDNAVDYNSPTNYGVMLQGTFLILFYVVADVLIKQEVI